MAKPVKISDINLLMLNVKSLKYFGFLSMEFEKEIIVDNPEASWIDIQDKKLIYHLKDTDSLGNAVALTVHNMLHILSCHYDRCNGRQSDIWTVACDHIVNSHIKRMSSSMKRGVCELPAEAIYLEELSKKLLDPTAEEIYSQIMDNSSQGSGDGEGEGGCSIESDNSGNVSVTSGKNKMKAHQDVGEQPQQQINQAMLERVRDSAKLLFLTDSDDLKGDIDAGVVRYLEHMFEVNILWEEIFKQSLLYYSKSLESRTWTRKNIYIPNYRVPGYADDCNSLNTLIVSMDLSGSISDSDYAKFASIVCESAKYYKRLVIISHEVSVTNCIVLADSNPKRVFDEIRALKGGGGTSHQDVFDKIDEMYLEGQYEISSIVFLTDFYSDVEEIYMRYRFIKEISTIWIIPQYGRGFGIKNVHLAGCQTTAIPIQM